MKRARWEGSVALAGTVCLLASLATATATEPDPLEVERTTPPAVVRASRLPALPEDPTSFTRVIEVEAYAGENKRVEDLLETTPGVHVRRFGGPGQPSEISIRGSTGAQVVVLLDGVRLNSSQSGTVDLSTIPQELIERIEVSRGGGSVQTGSDAIGGVVNIITKRVRAEPTTTATAGFGSFGTWQGSLTQTGRLGENELLLGYDGFKTAGDWDFEPVSSDLPEDTDSVERLNNRSEHHSGLLKVGRDLGEQVRIELTDSLFHGSEGRPGLDQPTGGAERGQRRSAHLRRTRNAAQLRIRGVELTDHGLDGSLALFHRYDRGRFRDPELLPAVDTDDRNSSIGGRADVGGTWGLGPVSQRLSLGTEVRGDALDAKNAPDRDRLVVGVFAQDDLAFWDDRVHLVSALRLDDTEGFDTEWLPRIGLMIEPVGWLRLRGNAERSYRVPNYDELFFDGGSVRGNPSLAPEEAFNFDLGLELAFGRMGFIDGFGLEVAGFYNDIENTIVFQQTSPNVVQPTNIPDVRVTGVELSGRVAAFDGVTLSGSWTYLDTKLRSNGNPLPGRPKSEADVRLELAPFDGWVKLVGALLTTDEIALNESGRAFLSGRTTYDASLALDVGRWRPLRTLLRVDALVLSVVATNLSDRAVRDSLGFPQPGRVLSFRIEGRR